MKKKTISLLMAAALASSMLAGGIVGYAEESDPITLSVWAPFTGSDGDVLREIIDNYNETNTDNITVWTFHHMTAGPAGDKPSITSPVQKQHGLFPFFKNLFQLSFKFPAQHRTVSFF